MIETTPNFLIGLNCTTERRTNPTHYQINIFGRNCSKVRVQRQIGLNCTAERRTIPTHYQINIFGRNCSKVRVQRQVSSVDEFKDRLSHGTPSKPSRTVHYSPQTIEPFGTESGMERYYRAIMEKEEGSKVDITQQSSLTNMPPVTQKATEPSTAQSGQFSTTKASSSSKMELPTQSSVTGDVDLDEGIVRSIKPPKNIVVRVEEKEEAKRRTRRKPPARRGEESEEVARQPKQQVAAEVRPSDAAEVRRSSSSSSGRPVKLKRPKTPSSRHSSSRKARQREAGESVPSGSVHMLVERIHDNPFILETQSKREHLLQNASLQQLAGIEDALQQPSLISEPDKSRSRYERRK
ncbi:unnamed protein product [Gongylonema pulchrum]|uniref:Uncharacterized protein n=1 Tax=Gongylonema pulchrum TaxID=637853 RepID=A0A183DU74_9BILA|nr:unnamed protein product [Gongylonema pulchrum]